MLAVNHLWFWCHKVIPLVYDDSLSYYELLCKVVQKVNEIISNMSELDEYIKEEIAHAFEDTDAVRNIIDQILADNNIALRTDFTSNDIDINTTRTLYYTKSEYYKTLQSFTKVDNDFICVFGRYDRIHYVIRRFNSDWEQVGGQSAMFSGHGNDCASDGVNRLFVLSSYYSDSVYYDDGLIRIFSLPEFTQVDTWTVTYNGSPVRIDSFCYDRDNKLFYCFDNDDVYIYNDDVNHSCVGKYTMQGEIVTDYHDQYMRMAQQGSSFKDGKIARLYAYPNILAFYDAKTLKLDKVYTIPYKSEIGNALVEMECGCFSGDDFYVSAFQRDADQGFSSNVNCGAWNTILKINFWTNVPKGYEQKDNEYGNHKVYVDGSTTNTRHYGTLSYPYRTLSEAMATLHSVVAVEQPVDIYCRIGTNVGVLRGESFPNTRINRYRLSTDPSYEEEPEYEIEGIDVSYSDMQIYYAHVKKNDATSDGSEVFEDTITNRFGDLYLGYCTVDAPTTSGRFAINNVSGKLITRQCDITAYTGGYCVRNGTEGTWYENDDTLNGSPLYMREGALFNRSGKISAINDGVYDNLKPASRTIIFDGSAQAVGEYNLNTKLPISNLSMQRSCIVTVQHNTGKTEYMGYLTFSSNDAFIQPQALTVTLAGVAQMHYINLHINNSTNKLSITANRTVKLTDGTVYNYGDTVSSGIQFASVTRVELV